MIYRSFIFYHSTIETNKFTFDVAMVLNGTERCRPVLNGIEWYLNGIPLADFYKVFYYSNISL